jgi:hypothetical protein
VPTHKSEFSAISSTQPKDHQICNRTFRFHRLRYKLSPVGALEVSLGELQQIVMPEQISSVAGSGSPDIAIGAAPATVSDISIGAAASIVSDAGSAISSTITFRAH